MKKKKGFTLIELLVVIAIIAMLLAILMPALNKVKKIAQRVVCGTNLKGLGTAQSVYANDYEDQFTKLGSNSATWNNYTQAWQVATATPETFKAPGWNVTVSASLYLLIREADVSPKSFVCPATTQKPYEGQNTVTPKLDLVELWDFGNITDTSADMAGTGSENCVSYAYQLPFSSHAASGAASASFAVMADKNPWYDADMVMSPGTINATNYINVVTFLGQYYNAAQAANVSKYQIMVANAGAHGREGQNVTFGDGHSAYEKYSDVGVKHDNIYTPQAPNATVEAQIRTGWMGMAQPPATDQAINAPQNDNDSFLVNDITGR